MKILDTFPIDDQFYMPAEYEEHSGCWLLWPERGDIWRRNALPAQDFYISFVNKLVEYEQVTLGVSRKNYNNVKRKISDKIRLIEISYNDVWVRDTGAIYLVSKSQSKLRGLSWNFNAWGGIDEGLYYPWDLDNQISDKMCDIDKYPIYKSDIVLEGGSVNVDGEGTLLTTEECLLNRNRNPHKSKSEIETYLKRYFNVKKVIWIPKGVCQDETGGHIDNLCCFTSPAEIALTWSSDPNDPQSKISTNTYNFLKNETDAKGRLLKIHKLHHPTVQVISENECKDYAEGYKTIKRNPGDRLPASYINFYQNDKVVFFPLFGNDNDERALQEIKAIIPNKEIISFYSRELLLGGGNIHCITQQIPKLGNNV